MATSEITELKVGLTKVEMQCSSNTERLDEVEKSIKENTELIIAINSLATEVKYMREDLNKVTERVDAIDNKDSEIWGKFKWAILVAIIGTLVTFISSTIGLQ